MRKIKSLKPVWPQITHTQAALVFLLLSILFYSPVLLGLRTFPDGDFTHHFLPFSLFQQQELFSGRVPLWNPYTYSGHPFLADTQAAVFYPVNLVVLTAAYPLEALFNSKAAGRLYFLQVEAILHVALAGFFVYLFVQDLTRHRIAGLLAGITFAFSGYLTGYPPLQFAVLRTAIWLPLILYLLRRGIEEPRRSSWWLWLIIAASSAFMAGHPQTILHIGYAAAAWAIFLLAQQWQPQEHSRFLRAAAALALSTVAIVGLSAIQLLPSLEFTQLSVRAETSYDFVSAGFPLRDTWQLILPSVFTWFSPIYIGVAGLGMAVCAVGLLGSHQSNGENHDRDLVSLRSITLFWIIITLVALLVSYGRNGFLYPIFYRILPGWDLFRQQERAAYIVTLGLSVLAGFGYTALTLIPIKRRRLLIVVYAALVIGSVYAFGLLWQVAGDSVISNLAYLGIAIGTLVIVALLSVALWWDGWDERRTRLVLLLAVVNLFAVNFTTNLADFGPTRKTILGPELSALEATYRESRLTNPLPSRAYNEFRIYDDYGMGQRIEDVWGSSPLKLAHYAQLFDEFPLDRMWRLTAVDHVLTWRRELFEPSTLLGEFPQAEDTTFLHRLTEPNPRAWMVPQVFYASDTSGQEVAALLADHNFNLESGAIVMQADPAQPLIGQGSGIGLTQSEAIAATVSLDQEQPGHVHVTAASDSGGFLLISENYMPGWRIENPICNGSPAECDAPLPNGNLPPPFEIKRANLTLIGLAIPAGEVRFDLVYRPQSFRVGAWISGATLLLLALIGLAVRFKRPGTPP